MASTAFVGVTLPVCVRPSIACSRTVALGSKSQASSSSNSVVRSFRGFRAAQTVFAEDKNVRFESTVRTQLHRNTAGAAFHSTPVRMVKVNEKAPEFTALDQTGKSVSLKDYLGKKNIVLYFYPKDDTPGCTKESCAFRDQYTVFQNSETEVIGVSSDSPDSHKKFAAKYNLPFTLLSDSKGEIRKAFGVPGALLGLLPGRVTYVIDKTGVVRLVFDSSFGFKDHVDESLKVLTQIAK